MADIYWIHKVGNKKKMPNVFKASDKAIYFFQNGIWHEFDVFAAANMSNKNDINDLLHLSVFRDKFEKSKLSHHYIKMTSDGMKEMILDTVYFTGLFLIPDTSVWDDEEIKILKNRLDVDGEINANEMWGGARFLTRTKHYIDSPVIQDGEADPDVNTLVNIVDGSGPLW